MPPAPPQIYTLSLHDALPISHATRADVPRIPGLGFHERVVIVKILRSEEHTSELQSPMYLVCRLLLEKKKVDIQFGSPLEFCRAASAGAAVGRRQLHALR